MSEDLGDSLCPICGKNAETGEILKTEEDMAKFELRKPASWRMCAPHMEKFKAGFVALIEVKEKFNEGEEKPVAVRTGKIVHIPTYYFPILFGKEVPKGVPLVLVEPNVIDGINQRVAQAMKERA